MMRLNTAPSRKRTFMLALPAPSLMPDLAEYMTVKEAAQELGFTLAGIHKLVRKSKLDAVLVGRMYLVSRKSIRNYSDQTKGMGKNDPTRGKTTKED